MESRLFAVYDHNREDVRFEAVSNSLSCTEILQGSGGTTVFFPGQSSQPIALNLVEADAVGGFHHLFPPVRPAGEPEDASAEPAVQGAVQPADGSQGETRLDPVPDRNWFLNARISAVLPRVRGRLLDVGCGVNGLCKKYENGVGVQRVTDIAETEKFDTVTLVAVLNYIAEPEREQVLLDCYKRLNKYGRLIATVVSPIGSIFHGLVRRKQPCGFGKTTVVGIVEKAGFRLVYDRPFMCGLNRVYVFGKEEHAISLNKSA